MVERSMRIMPTTGGQSVLPPVLPPNRARQRLRVDVLDGRGNPSSPRLARPQGRSSDLKRTRRGPGRKSHLRHGAGSGVPSSSRSRRRGSSSRERLLWVGLRRGRPRLIEALSGFVSGRLDERVPPSAMTAVGPPTRASCQRREGELLWRPLSLARAQPDGACTRPRHYHARYNFDRAHTGRLTKGRVQSEIVYGARKVKPR